MNDLIRRFTAALALLLSIVILPLAPAHAGSGPLPVTINWTLTGNCRFVVPSTISLGSFSGLANTQQTASATISVTCMVDDTYSIAMTNGNSGNCLARSMSGSGHTLAYNLYTSTTYTSASIWGNSTCNSANQPSTTVGAYSGRPTAVTYTVYAMIPASTTYIPGSYTDSITATLTF